MSKEFWIYHERQEALLCGQHALNNLVQACVFSADQLAEIAQQLDEMELTYMAQNNEGGVRSKEYLQRLNEGSGNVDPHGNFSIEVLRSALMNKYNLALPNIRQEGVGDSTEITEMEGFICHREAHWFAIRKINGRFWNLNSTKEQPELISHFHLAAEMDSLQAQGYSVFCVIKGLPEPCTSAAGRSRGLPQYWWKEEDLVQGKTDAVTAATDPWRNVGHGMRLDGKPTRSPVANGGGDYGQAAMGDLSEEEMIQIAMMASLQQEEEKQSASNNSSNSSTSVVEIPPEPSADDKGAVRIQFRMPDGSRKIRRFRKTETVDVVYAFVQTASPSGGKMLELRCGFPPKDLASKKGSTIEQAELANETVQGRYA